MKPRDKITNRLIEIGFTEIQLFYWAKDGWYLHCEEAKHFWIGQNWQHVIRQITIEFPDKKSILYSLAGLKEWDCN